MIYRVGSVRKLIEWNLTPLFSLSRRVNSPLPLSAVLHAEPLRDPLTIRNKQGILRYFGRRTTRVGECLVRLKGTKTSVRLNPDVISWNGSEHVIMMIHRQTVNLGYLQPSLDQAKARERETAREPRFVILKTS